jgi:recombination protein U
MIKYPNGESYQKTATKQSKKSKVELSISSANRGMSLEEDINISNEFYKEKGICLVTKRPTPINIVKVDYSHGAKIIDAYFEKQSTTDYNGVYKGKYLDFEAKTTKLKTSFPLANITPHQIEHLKNVILHNGIAFFIISFDHHDLTYLIDASFIIHFYENEERKSIPLAIFKEKGIEIKRGFYPRLNYIEAVDEM